MKGMTITTPTNALDLQKHLLETFTILRAGGISTDNAKAQAAIAREVINLMKIELLATKILDIEPIYSPVRKLFGYDQKKMIDKKNLEKQKEEEDK